MTIEEMRALVGLPSTATDAEVVAAYTALLGQNATTGEEPVTLSQAKTHCRVLHDDDDALIEGLITAAREWVETYTGQTLLRRTVSQHFDRLGGNTYLHAWPITAGTAVNVSYLDSNGELQSFADARLAFSDCRAMLVPPIGGSWPATYGENGSVLVSFEAGYAAPDDVPQSLKQAIMLLVGHWFVQREPAEDVPFPVAALCSGHRVMLI